MDEDIAVVGIGCSFPGGKCQYFSQRFFAEYCAETLMMCMVSLQVRDLTISGKFLLMVKTVLWIFLSRDLMQHSGMILMTPVSGKYELLKLLL